MPVFGLGFHKLVTQAGCVSSQEMSATSIICDSLMKSTYRMAPLHRDSSHTSVLCKLYTVDQYVSFLCQLHVSPYTQTIGLRNLYCISSDFFDLSDMKVE